MITSDHQYEEVKKMVTVYEQLGIEKGKKETLLLLLNKKFGPVSEAHQRAIQEMDSMPRLNELLLSIVDASTIAELDL